MRAYHERSNVEATFSAIKHVFGDFVRSKNKTARMNEIPSEDPLPQPASAPGVPVQFRLPNHLRVVANRAAGARPKTAPR